jgi:hypothetical protein
MRCSTFCYIPKVEGEDTSASYIIDRMLFVWFEFNDVTTSYCIASKDLMIVNNKLAGMWKETATA